MPHDDRFIAWAIRDLMRTAGISEPEARKIIEATYLADARPEPQEIAR